MREPSVGTPIVNISITTLDIPEILNIAALVSASDRAKPIMLDFSPLRFARPFGLVYLTAILHGREVFAKLPLFPNDAIKYAAHVGLFETLRIIKERPFGEPRATGRYVPITTLSVSEVLHDAGDRGVNPNIVVQERAGDLALVLSQSAESELFLGLRFAIRELLRNGLSHSRSGTVWVAAQYWEVAGQVEVAVADAGIGIAEHLSFTYPSAVGRDALLLALEPGVSGNYTGPDSDNSGYGLFITRRLCSTGGSFLIASSGFALSDVGNALQWYEPGFAGTAVRLVLRTATLNATEQLIPQIIADGERLASLAGKGRVVRASDQSRL